MEEVLKGNKKVKHEASQKAMKALIAITGLLCLGVVCGVVLFTTVLNSL